MGRPSIINLRKITLPETMDLRSSKDLFGFVDWTDFLTSTLGMTDAIWETAAAMYLIYFMMVVDWATGLGYAVKTKTYWSRKNWRMPIYFVFTTLILAISFNLSKHSIIFKPMPPIVYGGFCSVYFSSIIENLAKLELLPPAMTKLIKNRFGFKVLFDKADVDEKLKEQKAAEQN